MCLDLVLERYQSFLFHIFALRCVWIYVFGSCFRTLSVILVSYFCSSLCLDLVLERYQSFLFQNFVFGSMCLDLVRTLSVILVSEFCVWIYVSGSC